MRSLAFLYAVFALASSTKTQDASPPMPDPGGCSAVYLLVQQGGIGPFFEPVREVSFSIDGSPFNVKGKLFRRDWGAFWACGKTLTLRFRNIIDGRSVSGASIHPFDRDFTLNVDGKRELYFVMGWRWREVSPESGKKALAEIIDHLGPPEATGWLWPDRRDWIYGKGSKCALEKSEQCP